MEKPNPIQVSPLRLRVGIALIFVWWIPFWLLQPIFTTLLGITSAEAKHQLFVGIVVVQTIVGLVGLLIAGKQVFLIMKQTKRKEMPRTVWRTLRHGTLES